MKTVKYGIGIKPEMEINMLFAKSGLIPRRSAAAQIRQRLQKFGIKPDGIINFLTERASAQTNTTPKIPALRRLIMLHGAGCDHIMFEKQADIFDDSYNIIAWDARGHGLSKIENPQEFNFKDMYNDCLKLFEIHQIKNAILVGQSMGGNLAQEIAYYRPEIVSMLILIDCTKNIQKITFIERMIMKMLPIIFHCYPWRILIHQSADACGNTEYVKNYVKKCFERIEKRKFIEIMMSLFTCLHEDNEYQFKQPILLICGLDDTSGNIKKAMTIWSKKDDKCQLQMIKNAGHNSNQDNPEDVNKCILTFINERF